MLKSFRSRLLSLLIPALVLVILVHEILTTSVYSERDITEMRERAVHLAQQGDLVGALEQLRALSEVVPKNARVWGDYLIVLARHGRADQAIALANAQPQRELPDYALAELFSAALARGDFASAQRFADRETAQSASPESVAAARRQALAAAQQAPATATEPASITSPVAESGQVVNALPPAAKPLWRPRPSAVAAHTPMQRPPVATASPIAPVALPDPAAAEPTLAELARDAVQSAEQAAPAERIERALAALPVLDMYEQSLNGDSDERARVARRNAALDRVRALTLAGRLDAAATLFETLDTNDMPRYGLLNGADMYARRHEPDKAKALLDRAEQLEPGNNDILIARFYNQLDRERYDEAADTVRKMRDAAATPPPAQRDARIVAAMFAAYRNDLATAQRELEILQREEPGNADIALRRAQIYRWRGWPMRAAATYREALPHAADAVSAEAATVAALSDAHDFPAANALLDKLGETAPLHPEVLQAQQDRALRERAEYSMQAVTGRSSTQPITGDGDIAIEQRLYSAPIADQFRVFAHHRYDWADFPEGAGHSNRLGLGGDYRSALGDAAVEITHRAPDSQFGVALSGELRFSDQWSVFGEAQSDSTAVPLRALRNDIDGYSLALGSRYRFDESREARLSVSRAEFSDNDNPGSEADANTRDTLAANFRQSLYQSPHHALVVNAQAYYARNSAGSNVPYYNPDRETSLGGALEYSGILMRRYDSRWSHRLAVGLARYEQDGFDAEPIWDADYEHRWSVSPLFSVNGGVLYRSRVYDGDREGYRAIYAGFNWRF